MQIEIIYFFFEPRVTSVSLPALLYCLRPLVLDLTGLCAGEAKCPEHP